MAGSRSLPLDKGGRAGPGRRSEVQLLGAVAPPGPVLRPLGSARAPTQPFSSPGPTALPCPAPTGLWGQEQVPSWGWRPHRHLTARRQRARAGLTVGRWGESSPRQRACSRELSAG